jgi:hypothetical protein
MEESYIKEQEEYEKSAYIFLKTNDRYEGIYVLNYCSPKRLLPILNKKYSNIVRIKGMLSLGNALNIGDMLSPYLVYREFGPQGALNPDFSKIPHAKQMELATNFTDKKHSTFIKRDIGIEWFTRNSVPRHNRVFRTPETFGRFVKNQRKSGWNKADYIYLFDQDTSLWSVIDVR